MSVQLVVDMNLSIEWIAELSRHGWSAVHWSTVGDRADDSAIMSWALTNDYVVFTHDLDFGRYSRDRDCWDPPDKITASKQLLREAATYA